MGDRRGFRYELEAVQRKCDWDLSEAGQALVELNQRVSQQGQRVKQLGEEFAVIRAGWSSRMQAQRIDLELQRITSQYLSQLQDRISLQRADLAGLEQQREQVVQRSHELRKFADNIDEHRKGALNSHERHLADLAGKDADDIWLQRMNWRKRK
jgi:chromosome segregation ATPase